TGRPLDVQVRPDDRERGARDRVAVVGRRPAALSDAARARRREPDPHGGGRRPLRPDSAGQPHRPRPQSGTLGDGRQSRRLSRRGAAVPRPQRAVMSLRRLAAVLAAAVLGFAAVTLLTPEGPEVVQLRTVTPEGGVRRTRSWVADADGAMWLGGAPAPAALTPFVSCFPTRCVQWRNCRLPLRPSCARRTRTVRSTASPARSAGSVCTAACC